MFTFSERSIHTQETQQVDIHQGAATDPHYQAIIHNTNVVFAWPFYLLPVFYSQVVWLGLAPVLFV